MKYVLKVLRALYGALIGGIVFGGMASAVVCVFVILPFLVLSGSELGERPAVEDFAGACMVLATLAGVAMGTVGGWCDNRPEAQIAPPPET